MANEKAGDARWKKELDELAALPGEPVTDKEAAWQRLQERLQQRPRRKRTALYWLAAACVLLAVCLPGMLRQVPGRPEHPKGEPVAVQPHTRPEAEPGKEPRSYVSRRVPANPPPQHRKAPQGLVPAQALTQRTLVLPEAPDATEHAPAAVMAAPADTIHALALVPLQKRLRVVHINELGSTPGSALPDRMAGAPYLQARLADPDAFSRFTLSHNNSDNILKIKISPSN